LFARRDNTSLVGVKGVVSVRGFAAHLETSGTVTRPIDDALLGAHANSEGWIFIAMHGKQTGPTNFETLEDTIATASHSIAIDDSVIGFTAGDPITHSLHFRGCNIGKALPFLTKFREALGDHVMVTAPKHFHGVWEHPAYGTWEYMAYEFVLRRDSDFANRADLLAAFDAEGFTYIDGSAVPTADWGTWVPKSIKSTVKLSVTGKLDAPIGKRKTIDAEQQFRVNREPFTWTTKYPDAASVPATQADRQTTFEAGINADSTFDTAHPYPYYERLGYASVADFLAGYKWTHTQVKNKVFTKGTRAEYTILVPIVDMATGNLVYNFHPLSAAFTKVIKLLETDALYFASV
jgi:hypothetical protein